MKELPEVHQFGVTSIELDALGESKNVFIGDFGIQVAKDGRVWICLNGRSFIRFKPEVLGSD